MVAQDLEGLPSHLGLREGLTLLTASELEDEPYLVSGQQTCLLTIYPAASTMRLYYSSLLPNVRSHTL